MHPHPFSSIKLPRYVYVVVVPPDNHCLHPLLQKACRHEETDITREEKEGKFISRSQEKSRTLYNYITKLGIHIDCGDKSYSLYTCMDTNRGQLYVCI